MQRHLPSVRRWQSVANNHTSQNPEEEVRYERLLVMSNPNELYNQFAFHGKIAVDLVRVQGNYLTHLFELKTGSNNLRYGVYELVYYYFLLRRAQEENKAISFLNKPNRISDFYERSVWSTAHGDWNRNRF